MRLDSHNDIYALGLIKLSLVSDRQNYRSAYRLQVLRLESAMWG